MTLPFLAPPSRICHGLLLLLALALLPILSGCAAAGFAASVVAGDPKVEAQYVPTTRPMGVVVESYRAKQDLSSLRDSLTSLLSGELTAHHVAPVVDSYRIYDLRTQDPKGFHKLTIDAIGRQIGAEQVVYVDITQADPGLTTGGTMMKGSVTAMVKLVDARTGKTLWPTAYEDGYQVTADTDYIASGKDASPETLQAQIARTMADKVAKLFYKYTVEE